MSEKKTGAPKPNLSEETTAEIIKKAKALIRTDWGGQTAEDVIRARFAKDGIEIGPKSAALVRTIAEAQVEGCRRRTERRMDEAIRRSESVELGGGEKLP